MTETLQKWEYRVQKVGGILRGFKPEALEALLNEWGEEGWEVIAVYPDDGGSRVTLIARRPLTRAVQRLRSMPSYPKA